MTHSLNSVDVSIFSPKVLIMLTFLKTLNVVLINIVAIWINSAKFAALGLLKMKFKFKCLEILYQCGKRVKTKIQKVLRGKSYVCGKYGEKMV